MSSTTAQRRGKPFNKLEPTVWVEQQERSSLLVGGAGSPTSASDTGPSAAMATTSASIINTGAMQHAASGTASVHAAVLTIGPGAAGGGGGGIGTTAAVVPLPHHEGTSRSMKIGSDLELQQLLPGGQAIATTTSGSSDVVVKVATVRRRFCGTGPFDRHWLNLDCCGLFCAMFTYFLHLYAMYCVCFILLPPWMSRVDASTGLRHMSIMGHLNQFAFALLAALAIAAHFRAMTTDPGAVPPDARPLPEGGTESGDNNSKLFGEFINQHDADNHNNDVTNTNDPMATLTGKTRRLCRRCRAYKPNRAHHCSICRRCIIKMDHHCPWVNNCVGIGNHKFFLLFIFYTWLTCMYAVVLVVARFSTCSTERYDVRYHGSPRQQHAASCLDRPTALIHMLFLIIEGLLFGMFTGCMMTDQSEVVTTKLTHIDRLKGTNIGGSLEGVTEVFGVGPRGVIDSRFRVDWLSPFVRVCFPPSVHDEVMGFCRPVVQAAVAAATAAGCHSHSTDPSTYLHKSGTASSVETTATTRTGRIGADIV